MQITVFGANGKVGRLVVVEALQRGLVVKAFVHGNSPFDSDKNLSVVQGDIYNQNDVTIALQNSDAVISTLGSWGTPNKDILSEGMKRIIPAMENQKINRIISLTGAGCRSKHDSLSVIQFFNRLPLGIFARKVLQDAEAHIRLLEESALDWTILRSLVMNDSGDPKNFSITTSYPMPWKMINRKSVALAMLDLMENENFSKKAPFIVRS